jgi:multiple sugar transport system ATP-binding protein
VPPNETSNARTASATALRLDGVSKTYDRVRALDRLSFEVAEGRFFVLFGPSSVGKTTTLRAIAGLVQPEAGRIDRFGADMTRAPIASRGVSMVFQSFALYPHLTVYDNFAYPLREARTASAEIDKRVRETAAMLRLTHRLERKPSTLSGGEQQRVALGRSLIRRPKILLLDEPLTNLDAKLRHDMRAELKRLHRQFGMTIIYATPDELEAMSMGEEIVVLRHGHAVQQGSPDELYESPADLYVATKIGSPHMNTVGVTWSEGAAGVATPIGPIPLPNAMSRAQAGEPLTLGIRPSDLRIAAGSKPLANGRVLLIEPLGDLTVLSLQVEEAMLRMVLPESQAAGMKPGDQLPIAADLSKVHFFRSHDGSALARQS